MFGIRFIIICCLSISYASQNDRLISYASGMDALRIGQYELAVQEFELILSTGWESEQLYYNLGNAFYRLGNIPGAIWAYESCLGLSPSNSNAKYNLKLANLKVVDKISFPEPPFYLQLYLEIKKLFSPADWVNITLFILLIIALVITYNNLYQLYKFDKVISVLTFLLFITIFFTAHSIFIINSNKSGIIYLSDVEVKSEPNKFSIRLFTLNEGLKVMVKQIINNWVEIELLDGKIGWIENNQIRLIE